MIWLAIIGYVAIAVLTFYIVGRFLWHDPLDSEPNLLGAACLAFGVGLLWPIAAVGYSVTKFVEWLIQPGRGKSIGNLLFGERK